MRLALTAAILSAMAVAVPALAFAAGSDSDTPPTPTETTKTCAEGLIWDLATQSCLTPAASTNDDNAMMEAVRELAYAGRYGDARSVLDRLDYSDSRVLTYYGFTARKMGDMDAGMGYYRAALDVDPDNLLARSYMGQGLAERGDMAGAREQLSEIRARARLAGEGQTWSEVALRLAIESGTGPSY